jgi:endo-1,4-beta-xylanase
VFAPLDLPVVRTSCVQRRCLERLTLLVLVFGAACDGPDPSSRERYVEGTSASESPTSRDDMDEDVGSTPSVAVAAAPYPGWGELTSACGDEHAQSLLSEVELDATDAGALEVAGDAGNDAGMAEAGARGGEARAARGLRDLGTLIGVALARQRLTDDDYAAVAARDFNLVTAENEMKWDATEPNDDRYTFGFGDAIAQFARDNDMLVKGHTLVWHSQLPSWVDRLEGGDAVREAMQDHIESVMAHYRDEFPGTVVVWDVVNEAIDSREDRAFYRDSVFHRELGEGFIAEAFEMAEAVDPDALLFYNDFGIESLGTKSQATFEMISELVESGVPIDGVGFQMHTIGIDAGPSVEDFRRNIQRYVDLGLFVSISEMDVNLCWGFESREQAIEGQRQRYYDIISTCLEFDECHSVSVWGMRDGDSWLNDQVVCEDPADRPWPLLFTDDFERKPAWWGVFDALSGCSP